MFIFEDCLIGGGLYFISISAYVGCIGVPYSDMDDYKILSAKKQENENNINESKEIVFCRRGVFVIL